MTIKQIIYFFCTVVLLFLGVKYNPFGDIEHPPGVLISNYPITKDVRNIEPWEYETYTITPLKEVTIAARVLSSQKYYTDRETDICPIDLALGWGPMSDSKVLDELDIYQGMRWFFWEAEKIPIPINEISAHSSNMHMIPGSDDIYDELEDLSTGSLVKIKGFLVNAKGYDGWEWKSSLSWTDTGGGACELLWITDIKLLN